MTSLSSSSRPPRKLARGTIIAIVVSAAAVCAAIVLLLSTLGVFKGPGHPSPEADAVAYMNAIANGDATLAATFDSELAQGAKMNADVETLDTAWLRSDAGFAAATRISSPTVYEVAVNDDTATVRFSYSLAPAGKRLIDITYAWHPATDRWVMTSGALGTLTVQSTDGTLPFVVRNPDGSGELAVYGSATGQHKAATFVVYLGSYDLAIDTGDKVAVPASDSEQIVAVTAGDLDHSVYLDLVAAE